MADRPPEDAQARVGRLYDAYGASLYRYAVMLLLDPAAAEDAVHQVFMAVLRLHRDSGGPVTPDRHMEDEARYLRTAVRNECYSALRRRRTRNETGHAATLEPAQPGVVAEERLALERAIRELTPDQRDVVHLHVFEGLTFREIGELTDTSINTVASRYRVALSALRARLTSPGTT
jgi:RNA polymerase sigma factor (sigma-70 family)